MRQAFAPLLQALVRAAQACYGDNLVSLAVFGSLARGTPGPESDVDVLVVCRELPPGPRARLRGFQALEDALAPYLAALHRQGIPACLSPVVKTAQELRAGSPLLLDMTDRALLLYDPEGFLQGLLEELRQRLRAAGARRIQEGSRWYWDLAAGAIRGSAEAGTSPLARAYLRKARARLPVLELLYRQGDYSDVVREAQEAVELATKAVLHAIGIDPPRWHDVGPLLQEYRDRLPAAAAETVDQVAAVSRRLRKERELAFYGDVDFVPTEAYGPAEAEQAMAEARQVVDWAQRCVEALGSGPAPSETPTP